MMNQNQQVVIVQNEQQGNGVASEIKDEMETARFAGKGLVIIFVSKESIKHGSGFLNVS